MKIINYTWLILLTGLCANTLSAQVLNNNLEKEKTAIRSVINNETETYYKQDFEGWKKNFVNATYFRQYGYWEGYPEKVRYYDGFDTLQKVKASQFKENRTYWKGSYEKRLNENFRIFKDVAWYSFEQESFDGKTNEFLGKSLELRVMEKHKGEWKIAYLGFHYLPLDKGNQPMKVETAIIQADSLLNQLIRDGNAGTAADLYTENFMLTASSGSQKTKADMIREIGNPALKFEINEITGASVSVVDKTAVLSGSLHQKGVLNGKSFDYRFRVSDTWVYLNGQWKIMAGHATIIN